MGRRALKERTRDRDYARAYMERKRRDPQFLIKARARTIAWRAANPDKVDVLNEMKRFRVWLNFRILDAMRAQPCLDCRQSLPAACMEFHHRESETKVANVGTLAGKSLRLMLDEVMKCDLICANCHRLRELA